MDELSVLSISLSIASLGIFFLFFASNDDDDQDGGKLIKSGDLVEFPAGLNCEWEVTKSIKKHYRLGS